MSLTTGTSFAFTTGGRTDGGYQLGSFVSLGAWLASFAAASICAIDDGLLLLLLLHALVDTGTSSSSLNAWQLHTGICNLLTNGGTYRVLY